MKKSTVVNICDMELTLIGEENEEYTAKVAGHVDKKMREVKKASGMSALEAAVLAAVNIADEYYRQVDAAENMRNQLKEYFDEMSRLKDEVAQLRRENARLQKPVK